MDRVVLANKVENKPLFENLYRRLLIPPDFHYLLNSNFQSRSIRLTNPYVVIYSIRTRHSLRLPPQLILARLENFQNNRIRLGTFYGHEHLMTM